MKLFHLIQLNLQGMLLYRGNRLIRRLQGTFGSEQSELTPSKDVLLVSKDDNEGVNEEEYKVYQVNGIVSVFKSKSSTTIDKRVIY